MFDKPNLPDETLCACLENAFGLTDPRVEFLPLGADVNTAVYRASVREALYFVKLRSGIFDQNSAILPAWLRAQGIAPIIAPLPALDGRLWAELDAWKVLLYPYIKGQDGYAVELSPRQWREFGAALRQIHAARPPAQVLSRLPVEDYAPIHRETTLEYLRRVETESFSDPIAARAAAFLREKQAEIRALVERTADYARRMRAAPRELVLCHTDLHAGNLHITPGGDFYIVDWDQPLLAPRERDLMFIGGGQGFRGMIPRAERELFYPGYGAVDVDPAGLGYYRCERIVVDIADFCRQIFDSSRGVEDREQGLRYLISNFLPGGTIEIAYNAEE
jgi:spectinomycin phosphotransferase